MPVTVVEWLALGSSLAEPLDVRVLLPLDCVTVVVVVSEALREAVLVVDAELDTDALNVEEGLSSVRVSSSLALPEGLKLTDPLSLHSTMKRASASGWAKHSTSQRRRFPTTSRSWWSTAKPWSRCSTTATP